MEVVRPEVICIPSLVVNDVEIASRPVDVPEKEVEVGEVAPVVILQERLEIEIRRDRVADAGVDRVGRKGGLFGQCDPVSRVVGLDEQGLGEQQY